MTKVIYSPASQADLVDIGAYIAKDSERRALAFIQKLRDTAERIARRPLAFRAREDLAPGLRSAVVGNHLILFRIVEDGIEIVHFVHGARDLPKLLER
jgi:toxin ParE1/3/4